VSARYAKQPPPFSPNVDAYLAYFATHGAPTVDALETALCHVGRNRGPELLSGLEDAGLLTLWALRKHVGAVWSGCEFPESALDVETWGELFDRAGYTVDGRRAPRPTAPLTLYRGATPERRYGLAWTPDRDVAAWFVSRVFMPPTSRVWRAVVEPGQLYAQNVRCREGEPEYVVDTCGLDVAPASEEGAP
jgi:hypothetical protein